MKNNNLKKTISKIKLNWIYTFFIFCLCSFSAMANSDNEASVEQRYREALTLARSGGDKLKQAIDIFQELVTHNPDRLAIFYDYLVILTWDNQNQQVAQLSSQLDLEQVPAYVLETVGKAMRDDKQFERAASIYKIAIRRYPERLQAHLGLGLTLTDQRKFPQAIEILKPLAKTYPENDEIAVALHYVYIQLARSGKNLKQTVKSLKQLAQQYPHKREIFYDYIVTLTWLEQDKKALSLLTKLDLQQTPAYVLETLGQAARRIKYFDSALKIYRAMTQRFPENISAQLGLVWALVQKKQFTKANRLITKLIKQSPKNTEVKQTAVYTYLALARTGGKQLNQAIQSMRRLTKDYPKDKEILHDYLVILTWAEQYKKALTLAKPLKLQKTPVYVLEALAQAAYKLEDFTSAQSFYRIALKKEPKRLSLRLGLANSQVDNGEIVAAVATLDSLLKFPKKELAIPATLTKVYVKLARLGGSNLSQAVVLFEKLYALYPKIEIVLYDYAVVLTWAEQDEKALELLSKIELNKAPAYIIETYAQITHRLKRYDQTLAIYQEAAKRFPEQIPILVGLARKTADNGDIDAALEMLKPLRKAATDNLEVLFTLGYVYRLRRNYAEAMSMYYRIRELAPENLDMRYLFILTAVELGALEIALEIADANPDLLDASEWSRLLDKWSAQVIQWAVFPPSTEKERFLELDQALVKLDKMIQQRFDAANWDSPNIPNYIRFNRIFALSERRLVKELINERNRLPQNIELPCHVLVVVSNAYHNLKYPPAYIRDNYAKAIEICPKHSEEIFQAKLGLHLALIENDEWQQAFKTIDQLTKDSATWRYSKNPSLVEKNSFKVSAAVKAAMARAYADLLDEAQQRLETMLIKAPNNSDIQQSVATIYYWRGWEERAREEFDLILAGDPNHSYARIMRTRVFLDLNMFQAAEQEVLALTDLYPDEPEIEELQATWKAYTTPQLMVNSGWRSSGAELSGEEWELETTWSSHLIDNRYRPFIRAYYSQSVFPEGKDKHERLGVGLNYEIPKYKLGAEISQQRLTGRDKGIRVWGNWRKDDYWNLTAKANTFSTDIPLRAYFQGIEAKSLELSIAYRTNERKYINVNLKSLKFSDGNQRYNINANGFQNIIVKPNYKLNLHGYLHFENNHRMAYAPYFNPKQDIFVEAGIDNRWVGFKSYEKLLWQNFKVSFGNHWQQDFGNSFIAGLNYAHDWTFGETFSLFYGINYLRRTYDIDTEYTKHIYMGLHWRF